MENGAAPSTTSSGPSASAPAAARGGQAAVGEDHLRAPRRPGREQHDRGVGRITLHDLALPCSLRRKLLLDEGERARGGDTLLELGRGEEDVERNDDRAETKRPEARGDDGGRVRKPDRDAIARADTPLAQHARGDGCPAFELRIRDRVPLEPQRRPVAVRGRTVCQDAREVHRGGTITGFPTVWWECQ